jgi:2-keto-4-pentenoate hydratase
MAFSGNLAAALWHARTEGGVVPRAAGGSPVSEDVAYRVQREVASAAAMPRVGWKVGATSAAAQALLATDAPVTAPMLAGECFASPAEVAVFEGHDTSVECEFAFRFARDLPPREAAYGRAEVLAAVGALIPAIEIVGCRFEGGLSGLGAVRLIADMAANTAWVKGPENADWGEADPKNRSVRLYRDGQLVSEGIGANALGDPLNVLEWIANHLSALGDGIKAGEVVSTGTCTGVTPIASGQTIAADFGDLGLVRVGFVAA